METQKVLKLVPHATNPAVVAALEQALAKAKSGEIQGIAIIGDTGTGNSNWLCGAWDGPRLLYAMEMMKQRELERHQQLER